ncbi:MAG: isoprenylcysteine carboxylmethyltransferase family protein [Gemmatimonadetes bacterium]|nr:isoprenylcysteine carboxylmethyltransferase family protein [Gemmatimonadota bacterium]
MNTFRYVIATVVMVSLPPGLLMWFVVHPFAPFWRRMGTRWAYTILSGGMLLMMIGTYVVRDVLLATDLGTNVLTMVLAIPCVAIAVVIGSKRKRYLTFRILVGVPEVSETSQRGALLTEGPYAVIRHPRYVEATFAVLGYALVANYVGTYVLFFACITAIYLIVILEERELRDRFGEEYDAYCRAVPRFLPQSR